MRDLFRYESDYTPENADYTHDSRREHEIDTLATELAWSRGCDHVTARSVARAELDDLAAYAAAWDDRAYGEKRERVGVYGTLER